MFAIGLWDLKENKLILARDRMGVKPLYYFYNNKSLVFSSEIRSLMACNLVPKKLNRSALYDYLNYSTVHSPNTIIDGVQMLDSGSYLKIDENDFTLKSTGIFAILTE